MTSIQQVTLITALQDGRQVVESADGQLFISSQPRDYHHDPQNPNLDPHADQPRFTSTPQSLLQPIPTLQPQAQPYPHHPHHPHPKLHRPVSSNNQDLGRLVVSVKNEPGTSNLKRSLTTLPRIPKLPQHKPQKPTPQQAQEGRSESPSPQRHSPTDNTKRRRLAAPLTLRNFYSGAREAPCWICRKYIDFTGAPDEAFPAHQLCQCRAVRPEGFQGELIHRFRGNKRAYIEWPRAEEIYTTTTPPVAVNKEHCPNTHFAPMDFSQADFRNMDQCMWNIFVFAPILRWARTNNIGKIIRSFAYVTYIQNELQIRIPMEVASTLRAWKIPLRPNQRNLFFYEDIQKANEVAQMAATPAIRLQAQWEEAHRNDTIDPSRNQVYLTVPIQYQPPYSR